MKVAKWGNSLAVRLPAELVERAGLKEGDDVEIVVSAPKTVELTRDQRREEALARIRAANWKLPAGWKMTRDEMNSREP